jgi:hypothetical protein
MSVTSIQQSDATPARSRAKRLLVPAVLAVVVVGGAFGLRGTGAWGRIKEVFGITKKETPKPFFPSVIGFTPEDCSTGVDPAQPITFELKLPNGPIDPATVNEDLVSVFRFRDRTRIDATIALKGDKLIVSPKQPLDANANFRVHLRPGLKDVTGQPVKERSLAFFTSSQPPAGVAFTKVRLQSSEIEGEQQARYTCVAIGPNRKLYATSFDGRLFRFSIKADGTLADREVFPTILIAERGPRTCTGFEIDPLSDPNQPDIFITHSELKLSSAKPGVVDLDGVSDHTGKVSRLSGPRFEKIEDLVVNLPRSARDHATNQPHFGPDGALYFPSPSNTAVGAPDHLLTATILRLDVRKFPPGTPALDAKTIDVGGPFDPNRPGSPLTIYASGLRMPYDLLWHSNGRMYTAVNGASSTGAAPANSATGNPGIPFVGLAEHDWFFKLTPGGYHGHPNPSQGTYVLNGGNPTARPDYQEVSEYPVGVKPESNWTPAAYDFGMHVSANGTIEYRSDRFGGALKGKIFVCRFNVGSDLLCIGLDDNGDVNYAASGIPGTTELTQPLDVVEDTTNGNLYLCEFGAGKLTLLRATGGGEGPTTAPISRTDAR